MSSTSTVRRRKPARERRLPTSLTSASGLMCVPIPPSLSCSASCRLPRSSMLLIWVRTEGRRIRSSAWSRNSMDSETSVQRSSPTRVAMGSVIFFSLSRSGLGRGAGEGSVDVEQAVAEADGDLIAEIVDLAGLVVVGGGAAMGEPPAEMA
ncbi:hypothetical protein KC329_g14 [Hortaea werneckii]|nr:hypothetical protein KC329_g14 [Hortaea werneckii]